VVYLGSIDTELAVGGGIGGNSIAARIAFWQGADPKLKHLANRLGDQAKPLCMAVHARVPWPMQPERARLVLLQAEHDADTAKIIEGNERLIAKTTEDIKALRRDGPWEIGLANNWASDAELDRLSSGSPIR
jgi:hypothetical protein